MKCLLYNDKTKKYLLISYNFYKILLLIFIDNIMFQCSNNSIEYTFSHPQNSYKNPKEITERIDYILYKFNKRNLVSLIFISYQVPSTCKY